MSVADNRPLTPEEIVRQLRDVLDEVNRSPLTRGRLIDTDTTPNAIPGKGLVFAAGVERSIPHKLGRRARGFVEVYGIDVPSSAHVGLRARLHPPGISSATHVTVISAGTGTCFIWVF